MADQIDIFRCASLLIKNYDIPDATYRAASRAEACLEQGDIPGQKIWLEVLATIEVVAKENRADARQNLR